jgi:hypothetical protein
MNTTEKQLKVRNFFLHSWRPYVWLALVGFLLYLQVLTFSEYTVYDDHFLIVENFSHIDELSDIGPAFFEDVSHQAQGGNLYRPLLTASFILSAQISGTDIWGYHLIDILLHCLSCCLLFAALQTLGFKRLASFIGTLVFCVHPALAQAVAWIAGRNDSLLAVFILSCFITYHKFLSTSLIKWYLLHILFFTCALFTKETTLLFPFLGLLYYFSQKDKKLFSLTTVLLLVGWGMILADWQIMRYAAHIVPVGDKLQAASLVSSHLWITFFYLGNIFWPFNLAFAPVLSDIPITTGIISMGLLFLAIALSERRDWKLILFSICWFIVFLIPTYYYHGEAIYPPKFYEHRIYVPGMGILFILLSLSFTTRLQFFKKVLPFIVFFIICIFGWMSYTHSLNFKNSLTLFEYDASTSPNELRRYRAITKMSIPEKLDQAIYTIQGNSQPPKSHRTSVSKEELGNILESLKNELRSSKNDAKLLHALAVANYARGFYSKSEENFLAAIQGDAQNAVLRYNLGVLYYDAHVVEKAEKAWLEALRLEPDMGNAHLNLCYLYYESGQYELAWDHYQKALQAGVEVPPDLIKEIRKEISAQRLP